jgi:hypothetical protein
MNSIPLSSAWLCMNCEVIGEHGDRCSTCGGTSLLCLARVLCGIADGILQEIDGGKDVSEVN